VAEQMTREERAARFAKILGSTDTFVLLVDALERRLEPQEPVVWLLKLWGAWHGFYPAERVLPSDPEEARALLTRLQQGPAR
jgi:hypothetical protein